MGTAHEECKALWNHDFMTFWSQKSVCQHLGNNLPCELQRVSKSGKMGTEGRPTELSFTDGWRVSFKVHILPEGVIDLLTMAILALPLLDMAIVLPSTFVSHFATMTGHTRILAWVLAVGGKCPV